MSTKWGGGTQKVQEMVPKRCTSGTHEVQEEVICAPDNARPLALFPPIFASPQITCGGLSVPSYTSSPPSRFVSPQFVAEFSSPSTCGGQNFPSSFSLLNFCHNFPSHIVSCRTTLTRLPQWRYECFSDAINIQWETYFLAYFLDPLFRPLALHENSY